ncbi:MAG: TonB-dependent receptor [Cyclobacteriaceae bacterium]
MKQRLLKVILATSQCLMLMLFLTGSLHSVTLAAESMDNAAIVQERIVTGKVTDAEDGTGIPGVAVGIKGTSKGAVTDVNGDYSVSVPSNTSVLSFSYIGYTTKEVAVGARSVIDISLEVDVQTLDEVVVVGYGTQSRIDVTGAIAQVDGDKINETPIFTVDEGLQGRAEGVYVSPNGSPGADPIVRIRGLGTTGDNDPLFVVDGVIVQGLGDLNPNDVESVSVLKDASTTAIFGALGSNGVLVITTKKGNSGETRISLDSYAGLQTITQRFDLLNREQYFQHMDNLTAAGVIPGRPLRVTDPQYADFIDNDTDWQDEIFQNGRIQSHQLSVSGGSKNSDFRISGGYVEREGVLLNTGTERYNFRANSNFRKGRFSIGETLSLSFVERLTESNAGGRTAIEHAIKMAPYFSVFNANNLGGYQGPDNNLDGQDAENPVRVLAHPQNISTRANIQGNVNASYELMKGLTLKGQFGLDYFTSTGEGFVQSFRDGAAHQQVNTTIGRNTGSNFLTQSFASLNYNKQISDHSIDAILVAERIYQEGKGFGLGTNTDLTRDLNVILVSNEVTSQGSGSEEYLKVGYLGRVNYNYQSKYFLSGSYRMDASSRFGSNNRWAPFYSVAGAWNIANESFFPDSEIVSNLKLRASYGTVGNDASLGNYAFTSNLNSGFITTFQGNNAGAPGTTAGNPENPDLKWEVTTMTNVGVDASFLDGQITLSAEYYNNISDDLLIPVNLAPSGVTTTSTIVRNAGSVEVRGVEFNLGYNDYEGPFQWSASLNFSTTENTILDLGGNDEQIVAGFEGSDIIRRAPGEPINHFFGFVVDGIFQSGDEILTSPLQDGAQPGDLKFVDISGPNGVPDGVIDAFDRTKIGNPIPDVLIGLNLDASYKGFDLNIFINGSYGNDIYNTNRWDLEGGRRLFNAGTEALNAWTPENRDTDIPRLTADPRNLVGSNRFIEDGSFTRIKNITLGYTLPSKIFGESISSFRVYVSAQNIATLTNYSGLDPEVGTSSVVGNSSTWLGVDQGNYPLPKSVIGGLQITF